MAWLQRLVNTFHQGKLRGEIDEELRFHIESKTEDNIARGMTPNEAREFDLQIPGDYPIATLANQVLHFNVTLKAIKSMQLPELTEEFAQQKGQKHATRQIFSSWRRTQVELVS